MRALLFVLIAGSVAAIAAVTIACSDDATPSGPPSEVPRQPDGAAILPDGAPNESVTCPVVTKSIACKVPADLTGVELGSAWATTDEDCKTKLYIAKVPNDTDPYTLARYTAKSITPACELELDTTFKAGEPGDYLAADDNGKVYTVSPKGIVSRIAPLPAVPCETDLDPAANALRPTAITMLREGTRGYVGFAKVVAGAATERAIAKLEPTEAGCKLTSITLSKPIKGSIDGLAIDTKGRVHVVDHGEKNEDHVAIYLPSGEYVTEYRTGGGGEPLVAVKGITACVGGLCVEDNGIAVAVDENGVYRAETAWTPSEATSFHVFVGTVRGPFFSVAAVNGEKKILVDLLAEHPAAK